MCVCVYLHDFNFKSYFSHITCVRIYRLRNILLNLMYIFACYYSSLFFAVGAAKRKNIIAKDTSCISLQALYARVLITDAYPSCNVRERGLQFAHFREISSRRPINSHTVTSRSCNCSFSLCAVRFCRHENNRRAPRKDAKEGGRYMCG